MPPSSKQGGPAARSPSPATQQTSVPATKAPTTTSKNPSEPKQFGELYFQPTREMGETGEAYRGRLDVINKELQEKVQKGLAPKNSPGSFVLLTQTNEKGYTGETRFDKESAALQKKMENAKKAIDRYRDLIKRADDADRKIYDDLIRQKKEDLQNIEMAIETLSIAGGEHYMTGKKDKTFATTPRTMKGNGLNTALEQVIKANGEAVGNEVRRKSRQEWEKGDKLRRELSELRVKAKNLLKGKLPENVKDDLYNTLQTLEKMLAYDGTSEFELPHDKDTARMIANLQKLIDGTALQEKESVLPRTPGEALAEIASTGEEITRGTLMAHGLEQEDAENLITLLIEKGILKDNS